MQVENKIKVLFVADIHNSKSALKEVIDKAQNVDLVVDLGDFSFFGKNQEKILKEYAKLKKQVLVLHGNHEFSDDIRKICSKHKNLFFLHEKFYEFENLIFYGNGDGGFSCRDERLETKFKEIEKRFKNFRKKTKNPITILAFHSPPKNTCLDIVHSEHVGSKTKENLMKLVKPNVVVSGHIHDSAYARDTINKAFLLNPGPRGRIINFSIVKKE
jgi:Icc-related predicted phosphoesterase